MYSELSHEAGSTWRLMTKLVGFHLGVSVIKAVQSVFVKQKMLYYKVNAIERYLLEIIRNDFFVMIFIKAK